ncbi:MAG: lasso peptide biosynthesis B2 protein [Novosphingobium sp.]
MGEAARGFASMPLADKLALAMAWPLLGIAALLVRLIAFKRFALLLGQPIGPVGCVPLANEDQETRARIVRRAVRRAARISPWRNDCLPQALVGAVLCRLSSVPVTTHLGVRLGGAKPMEAHAWTCSGRVAVTGGEGFSEWTPVQCFAATSKQR